MKTVSIECGRGSLRQALRARVGAVQRTEYFSRPIFSFQHACVGASKVSQNEYLEINDGVVYYLIYLSLIHI